MQTETDGNRQVQEVDCMHSGSLENPTFYVAENATLTHLFRVTGKEEVSTEIKRNKQYMKTCDIF